MAGKFTVAVDNTGQLAAPFNAGAGLDFISKNGIAKTEDVNSNIATAKSEAIEAAKTETTKQVSTTKTELSTEINKKVNTTDYNNKVSSIESSISSIETTISDLNDTYATDAEVATAKSEAIEAARTYTNNQIGNIVQFNISVVDALPASNIQPNTIYLVPATEGEDKNINDEFLYIDGKWEQIGTTAINLDDALQPINEDIATNTNNIAALMDAFPTENPNIIDPKVSIKMDPSDKIAYEVGATSSITIRSTFTKATYSPKYAKDKFNYIETDGPLPFCGDAILCQWQGGLYENPATRTSTNVFKDSITKTFDNFTTYTISSYISYDKLTDVTVYNNKGNTTNVKQPSELSGSIYSDKITLYGTLPIYGTTSTIGKLTKQSTQIKSDQSTVEITVVAQTNKDNLQMILVPQDWCGENGASKIEQYDSLFKVYNDVTSEFAQIPNIIWDGTTTISLPQNDYISDSYLYPNEGPLDTNRNYVLIINTAGTVGERKLRITK